MPRRYLPLLALAACYDPGYSDATRCGAGGECPPGRRCVGEVCLTGDGPTGPRLVIDKAEDATGAGSVFAPDIDCPASCAHAAVTIPAGISVVLTALPQAGSFFQGWSGACSGPYRFCTVTGGGEQRVE